MCPSGSYKQVDVLCPFYKYDDGRQKIICEGLVDDSSLALVYGKRIDYEQQLNIFCCEHYRNCEIYRMLMENKYEE